MKRMLHIIGVFLTVSMFCNSAIIAKTEIGKHERAGAKHQVSVQRVKKTCWKVDCIGSTNTCINLGGNTGGGITMGIPGIANISQIPCGSHVIREFDNSGHNVFVFDSNDPTHQQGFGYINADAYLSASNQTSDIIEYVDSQEYTTYSQWYAALP